MKFKISRSLFILLLIFLVGVVFGIISSIDENGFNWKSILGNLSSELIGAVVLYFILEKVINQNETAQKEKLNLINLMDSVDNLVAIDAVNNLYKKGWLHDGSLRGRYFSGANLQNADFRRANLSNVGFYKCNLINAQISDIQLFKLSDLRYAIMPNGKKYDGRFRLKGDLDWAKQKYQIDIMSAKEETMADYYGVTLEDYIEGQEWAEKYLFELDS